jgi:dipeptide/tripeptide permease
VDDDEQPAPRLRTPKAIDEAARWDPFAANVGPKGRRWWVARLLTLAVVFAAGALWQGLFFVALVTGLALCEWLAPSASAPLSPQARQHRRRDFGAVVILWVALGVGGATAAATRQLVSADAATAEALMGPFVVGLAVGVLSYLGLRRWVLGRWAPLPAADAA